MNRLLVAGLVVVALHLPVRALPKGLADAHALPVRGPEMFRNESPVDIRALPPEERMAASGEEWAKEIGSHVGRVASSWSEGSAIPLLGPMVRSVVRAGRSASGFKDMMEDRYGVSMRRYGDGVAVMMRRKF
jgi:hypothetical protein